MVTWISKWLVVGIFLCAPLATSRMAAQNLSYAYDDAGNLKTVGKCQMGTCIPPPCPPGGCGSVPVKQPSKFPIYCTTGHCGVPDQPKLVSGGLHGHRVCGPFAGTDTSFFFDCTAPLPSSNDSGWQLTPEFWVNPDGTSHPNKAVVLTISTPTQTELFIELERQGGNRVEQVQVARQPGDAEVAEVGPNGQVAVIMSDDGNIRTWTLQFLSNTCTDVAQLNIYSVGSSGTINGIRSNPLHVWLLRDPAEVAALVGCP
jgi:hypothetical protein